MIGEYRLGLRRGKVLGEKRLFPINLVRGNRIEAEVPRPASRVGDPDEDSGGFSGIGEHDEIISARNVHDGRKGKGVADGIEFGKGVGEGRIGLGLGLFVSEGVRRTHRDAHGSCQKKRRNGDGHDDFHERETLSEHECGEESGKNLGDGIRTCPFFKDAAAKRGLRNSGSGAYCGKSF